MPGLDTILAASGTDLHVIAVAVAGDPDALIVVTEAAETGTGVPAALAG